MKILADKDELKVIMAYLAVCIIWGSTYLAIRIGVSTFPPELFAGIRFFIAGGLMLLVAALRREAFPRSFTDYKDLFLVGFIMLICGHGFVVFAAQWVTSSVISLIIATVPLFLAIIAMALPGHPTIGWKGWAGLLVGFGGVIFLVSSMKMAGSTLQGVLLLLVSSAFWAGGSLYSQRIKPACSITVTIGMQMLVGGIGLSLLGIFLGELPRIHLSFKGLAALIYLTIFGSIIGYSCYIYVLQKWSATKAGTYAYINPLIAVFLGFVILGEPLTYKTFIATFVILSGVLLVQLPKKKNPLQL